MALWDLTSRRINVAHAAATTRPATSYPAYSGGPSSNTDTTMCQRYQRARVTSTSPKSNTPATT